MNRSRPATRYKAAGRNRLHFLRQYKREQKEGCEIDCQHARQIPVKRGKCLKKPAQNPRNDDIHIDDIDERSVRSRQNQIEGLVIVDVIPHRAKQHAAPEKDSGYRKQDKESDDPVFLFFRSNHLFRSLKLVMAVHRPEHFAHDPPMSSGAPCRRPEAGRQASIKSRNAGLFYAALRSASAWSLHSRTNFLKTGFPSSPISSGCH